MRTTLCTAILLLVSVALGGKANAEATVTTDKPAYVKGEVAVITLHNSGPEDLQFNSQPFVIVYETKSFDCVYGCLGLPVMTAFPAGTTVTEYWNTGDIFFGSGSYTIQVNTLDAALSTTVLVTAGVGVESADWTTVKTRFGDREQPRNDH